MEISIPTMQQLLEAGVHFGHQVRRGHPKMAPFIFGVRDGVHIINLESSEKLLQDAAKYAYDLGKEGKILLFVGTKKQAQPIVKELAEKAGAPFINYRWIGGLLTNFDEIKRNIKKLTDLKEAQEKGELSKYTKKERLLISRKLEKFDTEWGGMANMDKLPDALFIIDCVTEKTAIMESLRVDLPVIGITDSNANPMMVTFPIPGNDDATKSIKILAETISQSYGEGLKEAGKVAKKAEEKETKAAQKAAEDEKAAEESAIDVEVAAAEEAVEKKELEKAERVV